MADAPASAPSDRDLASIAEARHLVRRAKAVQPALAEFSQEQVDRLIDAMAAAVAPHAEALATLAVEEPGLMKTFTWADVQARMASVDSE